MKKQKKTLDKINYLRPLAESLLNKKGKEPEVYFSEPDN